MVHLGLSVDSLVFATECGHTERGHGSLDSRVSERGLAGIGRQARRASDHGQHRGAAGKLAPYQPTVGRARVVAAESWRLPIS